MLTKHQYVRIKTAVSTLVKALIFLNAAAALRPTTPAAATAATTPGRTN